MMLIGAALSVAQNGILPLKLLRAGQRGVGKTVFQGTKVETFDAEILGILENIAPKQNIILARLSGGPIERTGVMQGMSGSPVYVDGRLIGAVALAFPFAKEPIAGIRPIEEMLDGGDASPATPRAEVRFAESRLTEVATPVSFAGFTQRTIEHFASRWRQFGMEPLQGVGGQSSGPQAAAPLEPGSMISVQLISGDMSVGADGTVTHIDGNRLYGFGHRFLGLGGAEMPFARSEVITLLPNLSTSFKISGSREPLGVIQYDGSTAVRGEVGAKARLLPVTIAVTGSRQKQQYRMEMIQHSTLMPFLLQMAVFSALDATERTLGPSTVTVRADVRLEDALPPLQLRQTMANDFNAPILAALALAQPLNALLQASSQAPRIASASIELEVQDARKMRQIEAVSVSRREVRPGDTIEIGVWLTGEGGDRKERVSYTIPPGTATGTLQITVADAATANAAEGRTLFAPGTLKPAAQVLQRLNQMRDNSRIYVRLWRNEPATSLHGVDLPNMPAGMTLLAQRAQSLQTSATILSGSGTRVAELSIATPGAVTGQRTTSIEVKE